MLANPGEFTVRVVRNPFDMTDSIDLKAPTELKSIAKLLDRVNSPVAVSINGGLVAEKNYDSTYPQAGDCVTIVPIPQGGDGGGKNILRLVAVVALTAFTAGMTTPLLGMSLATTKALVMLGGTMLINALLPPSMPDMGGFNFKDVKDSPTYGIDGAKNTAVEGLPVPLCFGRFRMAGNVIAMHSENSNNTQDLYTLLNMGEGEIESIDAIQLNDQDADLFEDVAFAKRMGTGDQSPIGWFNKTIVPISVAVKLTKEYTVRETTQEVDEIRVDFTCGRGLQKIDPQSGDRKTRSVTVEVIAKNKRADLTYAKTLKISGNTSSAVRKSLTLSGLLEGEYEVSVRRLNTESDSQYISDEVSVTDINEVINEKVAYKHSALLGVKVRLTDQLNGMPNITALVKGIKCNVWDGNGWVRQWTDNPAWIVLEMLNNKRFGGDISYDQIDLAKFKTWANFCIENDLTFNGVLDGEMNLWDAVQPVLRVGHAKMVMMGTRYSLSIEMKDSATMMFGQANIIKDSFSIEWLSVTDRSNEVEVSYYDKDDNHKQKTVRLYDNEAIARGEVQRLSSMTLLGVDNEEQAYYEAKLALNMNKYIRQTVSFDAHVDSIACRIGDVVYVQHDMPQWGFSGRVRPGSTESKLIIQEDLGNSDTILIKRSARKRYDATVSVISGEVVYLNDFDAQERVRRMKAPNGDDYEVLETTYSTTHGFGVVLSEAPVLASGNSIELWDTDIMEERQFWIDGSGMVNLTSPLDLPPDEFADFMAGKPNKMKKPFRITGITGDGNFVRTITAVEYNESVYDRSDSFVPTNNYSSLTAIDHSEFVGVDEKLIGLVGGLDTEITVSFFNDHNAYHKTRIDYSRDNGETWTEAGSGVTHVKFMAATNDALILRAVGMSILGETAGVSSAPLYAYDVQGRYAPPANVQGLGFKMALGGIELYWDENTDLDIRGYSIRKGVSWDSGEIVNALVQSTKVFVPVSEPGDLLFHVRAVDTSGVMSINSSYLDVSIGRPATVTGFSAVRNGAQINMIWDRLDDPNVMEYEVREGQSWGESMLVTKRAGNSYVMPTTVTSERMFWIKARHFTGMESEVAAFSVINEQIDQNRNIILSEDHVALSWPGVMKNVVEAVDSSNVQMTESSQHSEYHAYVNLPGEFTAHNTVELGIAAQILSDETIGSMDYPASDPRAARQFSTVGDLSNISAGVYIGQSKANVLKGDYDFSLDGSLSDEQGASSSSANGLTYEQGRFKNGARIKQTTQASMTVATDPEFKLQAWHAVKDDGDQGVLRLWGLVMGGFGTMTVDYLPEMNKVVGTWPDGVQQVLDFELSSGDEALIVVVQTESLRRLMVGKSNGAHAMDTTSGSPISGITEILMAS